MKIATAEQMRLIDQEAIEKYGIPGVALMENAGSAVARQISAVFGSVQNRKVYIFSGKGNNGGDGHVAARFLHNQGAKVKVFLVGKKDAVNGDAKINLSIIEKMGIDVIEVTEESNWDKVVIAAGFADCLVDALLGTGFNGQLEGIMAKMVEMLNKTEKTVFAVDVPSGVYADTGQIGGLAVQADYTITFGLLKNGLITYPGADYAGSVTLVDIGIPQAVVAGQQIQNNLYTTSDIRRLLPKRSTQAHKGTCGKVAVIAGSRGFCGAAVLAATGAMRAGAGLVTLGTASGIYNIAAAKLTEAMTRSLPEDETGCLSMAALPAIIEMAVGSEVLVLGPGLGQSDEAFALVRAVLEKVECPVVLDADGLNALAGHTDLLLRRKALTVLTPHPGEMARLAGLETKKIQQSRLRTALSAAREWQSVIVLKGAQTVVAVPEGDSFLNMTGNEGMATGGMGDVLSGVIAAFIAQGLSAGNAAVAGVYVHGLAGDIAAQGGSIGLLASDLVQALPAAIHGILTANEGKDC